MSLWQQLARMYNAFVASGSAEKNITYDVFPSGAAGVTLTSGAANVYGVFAQLAAAATVTVDVWLCGIHLSTPNTSATSYTVQAAEGAAGAEVGSVAVPFQQIEATAAGRTTSVVIPIPYPRHILAATRISARCQDVTGASTIVCKVLYAINL